MLYQDGITLVDEVEAYQQLYPFGTQEDLMAVHSMSGHGKPSHYDVFDMNREYLRNQQVSTVLTEKQSSMLITQVLNTCQPRMNRH